jgi:serine/threonine-protein kinase
MGEVYQVRQRGISIDRALKIIVPKYNNTKRKKRFEREIELTAGLSGHPNIINVHLSGETPDGRLFYVMDLIQGGLDL